MNLLDNQCFSMFVEIMATVIVASLKLIDQVNCVDGASHHNQLL